MADRSDFDRLVAMVHRASRRPVGTVERVVALDAMRMEVESALETEVSIARASGVTWAEIGEAFGVTRQAAFQRFGSTGTARGRKHVQKRLVDATAHGRQAIEALEDGRFSEVSGLMSEELAAALPEEGLQRVWNDIRTSVGGLENLREKPALLVDDVAVAEFLLEFEAGTLTGRTAWNLRGELAGIHFTPEAG